MSAGHFRRSLFGISAGGAATLLLAATEAGEAKATELDGALLAACEQFQREEAYRRRLYARVTTGEITEKEADRLIDERDDIYEAAIGTISDLPARTPEGLRAKALVVWTFYTPDPPMGSIVDDIMWSVLCQVAGKPEEDAAA